MTYWPICAVPKPRRVVGFNRPLFWSHVRRFREETPEGIGLAEPAIHDATGTVSDLNSQLVLVDDTTHDVGTFKIRGATAALCSTVLQNGPSMTAAYVASSGSFGYSMATATKRVSRGCYVYMPDFAPERKKELVRSAGGQVHSGYASYEDAKAAAIRDARSQSRAAFIDGVSWPVFIGNGTLISDTLRTLQVPPNLSVAIVLPIGIGSLTVPTALIALHQRFNVDIVGVEPASHCKLYAHITRTIPPQGSRTIADGAAVNTIPIFNRTKVLRLLTHVAAIEDEPISSSIRTLWNKHSIYAEGAGALAFSAVAEHPEFFSLYDQVWVMITGSNILADTHKEIVRQAF